jgi:glucan phosphoethanolaminetransferase (alkaline phosphatase superfamily)
MNKKFSKILTLVAGLIGLIAFYFFIRIVMVGDDIIETDADVQASIVSPFINFAKFVLIATGVIAVVFSILNLVKHPQVLKRTLLGVAALVVILVIAYSVSSDAAVLDVSGRVLEDGEAGSVSKWVSTGINFSAILGVIGLGFFVVDFVRSLAK